MSESKNSNLSAAKRAKNDEFYTQWDDIEKEMNAYLEYDPDVFRDKVILLPCDDPEWSNFTKYFALHFQNYGIKKLISTSYAADSKYVDASYQPSLLEMNDPRFDEEKTRSRGKKFVLENKDVNGDGRVNFDDIEWEYLEGDGDFRSDEVTALRDEADMVITNPPFSLFRDFIAWVIAGGIQFSVIGNVNAISYKEVFPLIKDGKLWLGATISSGDREFRVPDSYPLEAAGSRIDEDGNKFIRVKGVRWFTNIDHGRRHQFLKTMTEAEHLVYGSKKIKGIGYKKYDNYDAIEVPEVKSIPSDYTGVMGVPITFLDKYNPDQFEILGITQRNDDPYKTKRYSVTQYKNANDLNARAVVIENGVPKSLYARILIKFKEDNED